MKEQVQIANEVDSWLQIHTKNKKMEISVSGDVIAKLIDRLNSNYSPGIDGITTEHLKYGKSDILFTVLADLFNAILLWQVVPSSFKIGVIVPILKKPSLKTNQSDSFRPVTLSSTFLKILELLLLPEDNVSDSQFGFCKGRGTYLLYNDARVYFAHKKSPLYTYSLDAEKCFVSVWHTALFYKLHCKIPPEHWVLLYQWYNGLVSTVKWNNTYSRFFRVTKGTWQGSILSPHLFNIFLDDILMDLSNSEDKVSIGPCFVNSFSWADDITVMCTTVPGLQKVNKYMCTIYL